MRTLFVLFEIETDVQVVTDVSLHGGLQTETSYGVEFLTRLKESESKQELIDWLSEGNLGDESREFIIQEVIQYNP